MDPFCEYDCFTKHDLFPLLCLHREQLRVHVRHVSHYTPTYLECADDNRWVNFFIGDFQRMTGKQNCLAGFALMTLYIRRKFLHFAEKEIVVKRVSLDVCVDVAHTLPNS